MMLIKVKNRIVRKGSEPSLAVGLSTFINPWSYLILRKRLALLMTFDSIYFDGISVVILAKLFGINASRTSFDMTSMAPLVFNDCIQKNKSIAIIGSGEDSLQKAIENILDNFSGLNIVAARNGYFESHDELVSYCQEIIRIQPDVLIVGMGTPKQEETLALIKSLGWNGSGYTCGGFLHQTAKRMDYYPRLANALNLRWAYRILDEPKLFFRYFASYPKFALVFFCETIAWILSGMKTWLDDKPIA